MGLQAFLKVSGSKGLQLHVPLNTPVTYAQTGHFALVTAQALERTYPQLIVTDMAKVRRTGKVFIDWSQNSDYKTTVSVYSLRAKRDRPFVSLPVRWDELEAAAKNADRLYFDLDTALRRLTDVGDLFRPVLRLKQRLPQASGVAHGRRRSPAKTSGPAPAVPRTNRQGGRRPVVVQKHVASRRAG